MENEEKRVWGIHTKEDDLFRQNNLIAIGWRQMGDLNGIENSREEFKKVFSGVYPEAVRGNICISAGMLYRFCHEVQIGDYVVYPSRIDRMINIGVIEGDYRYNRDAVRCPHQRPVKWLRQIPRTAFSQGALYEAGSAMTFFAIKTYADEYLAALDRSFRPSIADEAEDETFAQTADEIIESTKDFILKELSKKLKGYDLEEFIADLLCAMGYRTTVSPRGGDRGIDITAYKDELPPRILVQVKSQDGDIRESMIQSLKGAMREGDYGLFVTLSNYTKNAMRYLAATPIIRGINGTELVNLILQYYGRLSEKYQKMIPLKMVYIPVPAEN